LTASLSIESKASKALLHAKPNLGFDAPKVFKTVTWTHQYDASKALYIMSGFYDQAYQNTS